VFQLFYNNINEIGRGALRGMTTPVDLAEENPGLSKKNKFKPPATSLHPKGV